MEHLTQMSRGRQIAIEDLPSKIINGSLTSSPPKPKSHDPKKRQNAQNSLAPLADLVDGWDKLPTSEELETKYIQVLMKHFPRKGKVAEILGMDRTTLYRKMRHLGLGEEADEEKE
jgi:DNA-binding NtrC family response regulator